LRSSDVGHAHALQLLCADGRRERVAWSGQGTPRLLEAKAYALLAMSEWDHFRRSGRVPNLSRLIRLSEMRSPLFHFGGAPLAEVEGPRRAVRIIDRYGPR
jgi:hypothetical protein